MAKKQEHTTKTEALESATLLRSLIRQAESTAKPLFRGFRIMGDSQYAFCKREGMEAYEKSQYSQAKKAFDQAFGFLTCVLRSYFKGSVEHYFGPKIDKLIKNGLPNDLASRMDRKVGEIALYAREFDNIDINQASSLYWEVDEAIKDITQEAQGRVDKVVKREHKEQEALVAKALEAQRKEQRRVAEKQKEARVAEMESIFAA